MTSYTQALQMRYIQRYFRVAHIPAVKMDFVMRDFAHAAAALTNIML
jgi:hypothetical protein